MKKPRKIILIILEIGLVTLISATLLAPAAVGVSRFVIAGGGSTVQGSNYGVIGTMGQSVVGDHGSSASYGGCSGFWCGGIPQFKVFLPIMLRY